MLTCSYILKTTSCLKKSKTLAERAFAEVEGFSTLQNKLEQSFSINGKAKSTLSNYLRCLAHLALHYKVSPEKLSVEDIEDYLYYCQKLHKTPSESFFKHTIFGLRATYKVTGMEAKRIVLPQIKRDLKLPVVLSQVLSDGLRCKDLREYGVMES